ncbi:hypothetical protein CVT26_013602 [Gymnopilus dilepis]|uniref:Uncharacterized protein n=1 Tax=Gymnopilus dilepis TaxID=231916 RepID=A0A409Y5N5_9AGAR|nr:hypothetical protein CVT26_013602 [Gymnopilus dilepis]
MSLPYWHCTAAAARFQNPHPWPTEQNTRLESPMDGPERVPINAIKHYQSVPAVNIPHDCIDCLTKEPNVPNVQFRIKCRNIPAGTFIQSVVPVMLMGVSCKEAIYLAVRRYRKAGDRERGALLIIGYTRSGKRIPFNDQSWPTILLDVELNSFEPPQVSSHPVIPQILRPSIEQQQQGFEHTSSSRGSRELPSIRDHFPSSIYEHRRRHYYDPYRNAYLEASHRTHMVQQRQRVRQATYSSMPMVPPIAAITDASVFMPPLRNIPEGYDTSGLPPNLRFLCKIEPELSQAM